MPGVMVLQLAYTGPRVSYSAEPTPRLGDTYNYDGIYLADPRLPVQPSLPQTGLCHAGVHRRPGVLCWFDLMFVERMWFPPDRGRPLENPASAGREFSSRHPGLTRTRGGLACLAVHEMALRPATWRAAAAAGRRSRFDGLGWPPGLLRCAFPGCRAGMVESTRGRAVLL